MSRAFIYQRPAVAGQDTRFHRVSEVNLVRTLTSVQGACGAHQVAGGIGPGVPGDGFPVQLEVHPEAFGRKSTSFIHQGKSRCLQGKPFALSLHAEGRHRQVPVHDGQCGVVFENAVRAPFHPDKAVCQDGKTGLAGHHLCLGIGQGVILGLQREEVGRQKEQKKINPFHKLAIVSTKMQKLFRKSVPLQSYES